MKNYSARNKNKRKMEAISQEAIAFLNAAAASAVGGSNESAFIFILSLHARRVDPILIER
jgi:hypothetical protein